MKACLQRKGPKLKVFGSCVGVGVLLYVCEIRASLITTAGESVQNNLKMEKDDYEVHLKPKMSQMVMTASPLVLFDFLYRSNYIYSMRMKNLHSPQLMQIHMHMLMKLLLLSFQQV